MTAREIKTERLTLRPHTPRDFDDVARMWADPAVVRHISGRPSTREESWSRLLRYAGHWATMNFGFWAVCEAKSGRFVGDVGLSEFRRETFPHSKARRKQAGYWHRGRMERDSRPKRSGQRSTGTKDSSARSGPSA